MAAAGLKAIVALGNPGPEYAATRHNVGWWLLDALAEAWDLGRFRRDGNAAVASGRVEGAPVRLIKPLTYMNRSGQALRPLLRMNSFEPARDLLIVVDEVALEPGRVRLRPSGSAGGHNGLKSIEAALGSRDYPRLRIGVGGAPSGADLANWVLSAPSKADRAVIMELVPDLIGCTESWLRDGTEAAMNRCNR
jgi:peptidyl-tRNA hydrolase, PTH1 family